MFPSKPLILVVDAAIADANAIKGAFEAADHDVNIHAAHSLAEARVELERATPDLVITNFRFADGKATEMIRRLRSCPVIVVSDRNDAAEATEAMKAGATDFLVKTTASVLEIPLTAANALDQWEADHSSHFHETVEAGHRWRVVYELAGGLADRLCDFLRPVTRECEAARDDLPRDSEAYWHLTSALKAARQSQDVAEYLRTAAGSGSHKPGPISIGAVVRDAIRIVKAAAPPSIAIRHTLRDTNATIDADPAKIRHLVYSICLDAFRAMPAGGLIEISMDPSVDGASLGGVDHGFVRLTFRDSRTRKRVATTFSDSADLAPGESSTDIEIAGHIAVLLGGEVRHDGPGANNVAHVYLPVI